PMTGLPSQEWLLRVRQDCQLFYGIADVCFSRGLGWQFCQLGRLVERADKTARILDVKYFLLLPHEETVGGVVDQLQWITVLKTAGGYQMFRQSRQLSITPKGVAQFLLLDPNFPRSVRFCLDGIHQSLSKIDPPQDASEKPLGRHVGMMQARWTYTDIAEIIEYGLHESIDRLQQDLNGLHNQLERVYFQTPQSFPSPRSSIQRTS
ncbi:MAG: alpha-E domain-containing protein, partial [Synechococcus sp. SB0669_bin_7]|nr:alpha-E domain-containing protein [Synechococcus sp. SB0669_bin_7]